MSFEYSVLSNGIFDKGGFSLLASVPGLFGGGFSGRIAVKQGAPVSVQMETSVYVFHANGSFYDKFSSENADKYL